LGCVQREALSLARARASRLSTIRRDSTSKPLAEVWRRVLDRRGSSVTIRERKVITGAHVIIFTPAAEATREFLRDALGLASVDAGGGWLIFALPPAEVAAHPAEIPSHELYLMCDDLAATMARLGGAGAKFGPVHEERWGRVTLMTIPGGSELSIYQPSHPRPTASA
jgi:catechol 2,3-dioxygenase-like lactoylglutathione lyase family enzyme